MESVAPFRPRKVQWIQDFVVVIKVTKLNKETVHVNPDLIEFVEANPDTAILLQGGKRVLVRESVEELIKDILKYKQFIHSHLTVRHEKP